MIKHKMKRQGGELMSVYRFISTAYDLLEVIWFSEKGKIHARSYKV